MKRFIYTEYAEKHARKLGLEARKAGATALFAGEPLKDGLLARAWIKRGYVLEVPERKEV